VPGGDGKVSFVDVRNIAPVANEAISEDNDQHLCKAYDIRGPQFLTYATIEAIFRESCIK
jgi:uncharacterized protein YbjT (DUF2867 family)